MVTTLKVKPKFAALICPNCNGRATVGYAAKPCPTCAHTATPGTILVPAELSDEGMEDKYGQTK